MKKVVLGLLLGLLLCLKGYSQHHLKSFNRIDAGGGLTSQGWFVNANFSRLFTDKFYGVAGLLHERWSYNEVKASSNYLNVGVYQLLFKIRDISYFNGGGGVSLLIDSVDPVGESGSKINSFNFGGYLGFEIENYLVNNVSLILTARQAFYVNKDNYGDELPLVFYAGAGIRLNLSGIRNSAASK